MKLKKLVSIVVASAMLTSAAVTTAFAEGDTDTWYARGDGSESNPYVIETAEQFKGFRNAVNEGACGTLASDNSITGAKHLYVELGADIDLGNESWTPIGKDANTFRGTFDGKNHIISNFKLDTAVSSLRVAKNDGYGSQYSNAYADVTDSTIYGLFATADDLYTKDSGFNVKGAIKNLGIENVEVAISGEGKKRTSVLVATPGAHTHIDNCYVKNVNVNLTATEGDTYFGALAGHSDYNFEIKSSYVSGLNFTSNQSAGRVIFSPLATRSGASTISDCYSADVTVNKTGSATVYATNSHYGTAAPTHVYSTFTVSDPLTSGAMFGWTTTNWAASQSATSVSAEDLKALNNVAFTNGIFVRNNSGGYPKLSWESNEVVYELTAGTAEGGSVALSSNTVTQGSDVTITVTPNANYSVVNIMANGESIWTGDSTTAVSETHTPKANTTYTATFKKELDPSLGKYIDPWQSKVYNNLNLTPSKEGANTAQDCLLNPAAYTVTNNTGYFTLSTGTDVKDVKNFKFYNATWGTRLLLKSTYDFDIKVNASDLSGVSDGEIASVGTAYRWDNFAGMQNDVQVKLVFEKKDSGYQWALYKDSKGAYTAIGDKTVPAELGKYYHITYDIDATIAQARIKITPEGGDTQVIESSNTGITKTYAWAFDAKNYDKQTESVYKGNKNNLSEAYLSFKKEATIDIKGFSTTTDKFICPNDITVGCEGSTITATVDTYAVKSLSSGDWNLATPPLYIAVFNRNKAFKNAAIGQITESKPASSYMLYKPTAELNVSGLEDGTYIVKVMLWSDSQVPFKGAVQKTLTVSNGTYTLN